MKSFEQETIKAQLSDEQKALKDLESAYKKAKKDCQEKIRNLNARKKMNDPNLQTVIHQQKYQKELLKQIDGVLNDLQTNSYQSVNEFFEGSYVNGYVGSMYEFEKQGIPITTPVDPKKVVRAVQTKSKLSQSYYMKQGLTVQNIRTLKKQIALECTRGIASGKSWIEVADSLTVQRCFDISRSDAMRIVRTEGNRINQQGRLDAGDEAIKQGCDLVKQWDATLDDRTRPDHQVADGQLREWDEDFLVGGEHMKAPSIGGSAKQVINCRCQLLKRPRWALDEEELKELQDRANYFGLDKTKDFEEFKQKYLRLPSVTDQTQVVKTVQDVTGTTTKFKSVMSQDDYEEYCRIVGQNPEVAKLYKHADEIPTIALNPKKAEYWYQQKHLWFNYPDPQYVSAGMSRYSTVAHEYGHFVDRFYFFGYVDADSGLTWSEIDDICSTVGKKYVSGWKMQEKLLSNSDLFLSALRSDMQQIEDEGGIVGYCLANPHTTTGIQDAVDGYGLGRIWWGHGDKYYNREYNNLKWWENHSFGASKDKPTKLLQEVYKTRGLDATSQAKTKKIARQYDTASELWANMMSAETTGGGELDTIKEKFPDTYKAFKDILKKVNG